MAVLAEWFAEDCWDIRGREDSGYGYVGKTLRRLRLLRHGALVFACLFSRFCLQGGLGEFLRPDFNRKLKNGFPSTTRESFGLAVWVVRGLVPTDSVDCRREIAE